MEIITLDQEIPVVCLDAPFPEGVEAAHHQLHTLLPLGADRQYYGLSWSDGKGGIIYKAAANELHPGEAAEYGWETFVLKKGAYLSETLLNFRDNIPKIGATFQGMLEDPRIDPEGYCLEFYLNEQDMRCMVPLDGRKI